jgi:hypothetical protein
LKLQALEAQLPGQRFYMLVGPGIDSVVIRRKSAESVEVKQSRFVRQLYSVEA